MFHRWKHPTVKCHLLGILQGFAELADGIITVGSLGFYGSSFEFRVAAYRAKRSLKEKIKKGKVE